ncbi:MAG: hypothetical protein JSS35_13700, partial [Proteobacteria bacterium]|nr:hypothetical protein [Pseudomonadota bacterium]
MAFRNDPRRPDEADRAGARSFEADDARLNDDLDRYERNRRRFGPAQYGHDENYRPGYHQGGTRFGFFGGPEGAGYGPGPQPSEYGYRSIDDQDFDPDYLSWRQQQLARHDRDYADWRREQTRKYDDDYRRFRGERREDFHQRFQDWVAQR